MIKKLWAGEHGWGRLKIAKNGSGVGDIWYLKWNRKHRKLNNPLRPQWDWDGEAENIK